VSVYPFGKEGDRCPVDNFDLNLGIVPRRAMAAKGGASDDMFI
jgi:hypothetical protein